ncbi:MAG: sulfatase-like hydrolase/transferase [Lentisphaerae bacterium]|nr:sulfatase-like hydrolase/transferase [Lentisphaerota bacterium]MBT4815000.1 sulfatase-like hydrolase/transferase [Lentisphaerota bacterium]MBT5611072.1 sulfatase-like hydrolase/transferase [Lentisphaerota bacterium]MBT7055327.1 sulfatase-like hydrolase/transferase [Lentisphaerota bacterium]MBT7840528.1 sulfatase-like hydrolase/transferase [Lentisphaerota bacterium]
MNRQPNILLICSDQHSPHVCGCYGNTIVETPNLDRLAREGTRFSSAYCNDPICVPSRMSFLTGRYPFRIEVLGNGSMLDSRIPTYAHLLSGAGYHTVLSGRMHFMGPDQRHGFLERLVGDVGPYAMLGTSTNRWSPLPPDLGHMEKPAPLLTVGPGSTVNLDFDRDVTQAAREWIHSYAERGAPRPFMMTVGYINPHCAYIAPPELYEKYTGRVNVNRSLAEKRLRLHPSHQAHIERTTAGVPRDNLTKATTAYYGLVDFIDQQVGKLLKTIEERELLDNTIIVYFSDHGEMLGEHGRWHKGCFFEGSAGVPLIVRVPGQPHERQGQTIPAVVSLIDLLPTLADWAGTDVPFETDGHSLVPLITGNAPEWKDEARSEYYSAGELNRMIRQGDWKYCYYAQDGEAELYNLREDPQEQHNRAGDPECQDVVAELRERVIDDGWGAEARAQIAEKLRGLAYYEMLGRCRRNLEDDPLVGSVPDDWRPPSGLRNYLCEQVGPDRPPNR